jgi:hypothetical protein
MPVARQVMRMLGKLELDCGNTSTGEIDFFTSGETGSLDKGIQLIQVNKPVFSLRWKEGRLW